MNPEVQEELKFLSDFLRFMANLPKGESPAFLPMALEDIDEILAEIIRTDGNPDQGKLRELHGYLNRLAVVEVMRIKDLQVG